MRHAYYESVLLIERVHRHFLELIKTDLDRKGVRDINAVQALILYNIGTDELTVGELTARGYYQGSNVSYNVKEMQKNGYLVLEPSPHDRRSKRVKLSEKGIDLHRHIAEQLEKQISAFATSGITSEELASSSDTLRKLERFWTGMINYGGN